MSIEERLNLLGEVLEEVYSSDASSLTLNYRNDTNYTLRVAIQEKVSVEITDENANYDDFHWSVKSRINDGEQITLGYGGSNNKQYDHRTWDTITSIRHREIKPGETIKVVLSTHIEGTSANHENSYNKGKEILLFVTGAL